MIGFYLNVRVAIGGSDMPVFLPLPSRSPDFWKSRLYTGFQVVVVMTGRQSTEDQVMHLIWEKGPDAPKDKFMPHIRWLKGSGMTINLIGSGTN
jgi:hypothetical protein